MSINSEEIRKIAHLARLGVDDDDVASMTSDISKVLELVEQLQAVDTSNVEAMAHPASASLYLRDDQVSETNQREALQAPAPATQDGYFLVPRVIE